MIHGTYNTYTYIPDTYIQVCTINYNMMCLGMVIRIFGWRGRARGTLAAADRYRFDQKFLRRGCGGERTSERARVLRSSLTHGCCELALLHMSRRSVRRTLSIIARWCTVHLVNEPHYSCPPSLFFRVHIGPCSFIII